MTTATPAVLLAGGPLAAEIREGVKERVVALRARGIVPHLTIVTVGEDPAGNPYVRAKVRAAEAAGATASVERLARTVSEDTLREALRRLGSDPAVHGIILQLPLPTHLNEGRHLEDLPPAKDVDGVHPLNVGRWTNGLPAHRPATPLGIVELLRRHLGTIAGKRVVIVGRSRIVGRPLSVFLSAREPGMNATVTLCHSETKDLPDLIRQAEILIVAMGKRRAITGDQIRPGAVVVDVGIHPVDQPVPGSALYEGDVDFESARQVASAITPVPGGVGPLTVAMILRNLVDAAEGSAART